MLEQLSDRVKECLEYAANARAKADETDDPASKAEFLKMEEHWLILARSHGFSESLEDFTTANLERRRSLTNASELTHDQHRRPARIRFRDRLPLSNPAMTGRSCTKSARC